MNKMSIESTREIIRGKISSLDDVFSASDAVYVSLLNLDDDADLERARRKVLKYDRSLHVPAIRELANGGMVTIAEKNGRVFFQLPFNDRLMRKFKELKGWEWENQSHTFHAENCIVPVRMIEDVFDVFIEYANPLACFAAVSIVPESRSFRVAVFANGKSVNDFLNRSRHDRDPVTGVYDIKIESLSEMQEKIKLVESSNGRMRFLKGYLDKIKKMVDFLVIDKKIDWQMKELSISGRTLKIIRSPEGLAPYPFQVVGVEFIEKTSARTLIADEMGTGKTIITCLFLYNHPENYPAIVIVPGNARINWSREVKKWCVLGDDDIQIIRGRKEKDENKILPMKKVYIINYEIISTRLVDLLKCRFKISILDEAHAIKNSTCARTKACLELSKRVPHVICLTGTPIINRPIDAWNIIEITKHAERFGGFWNFVKRYCNAYETQWGWNFDGSSNLQEMQERMRQTFMIRRFKADVLPELPPKRRIVMPVEISNRNAYEKMKINFKEWYEENKGSTIDKAEALVKIEKLKQVVYEGKKKDLIDFIHTVAENHDKILIFFYHRIFLSEMMKELKRDFTLDSLVSENSAEERQEIADYFNGRDRCILLCSMQAVKESINLQTAQAVIFAELGWTSAAHDQAESRAHRIGQEAAINIYYVIGENTIEEGIVELLNKKKNIIDGSVGTGDITDDFLSIF